MPANKTALYEVTILDHFTDARRTIQVSADNFGQAEDKIIWNHLSPEHDEVIAITKDYMNRG